MGEEPLAVLLRRLHGELTELCTLTETLLALLSCSPGLNPINQREAYKLVTCPKAVA